MRFGKVRAFFSGLGSKRSRKEFAQYIRDQRPDIVHVHNLYPLISPAILEACRAAKVPVVMTVHNFRLVCPNGLFFSRGQICERCLGGKEYWCVLRDCETIPTIRLIVPLVARTSTCSRSPKSYHDQARLANLNPLLHKFRTLGGAPACARAPPPHSHKEPSALR